VTGTNEEYHHAEAQRSQREEGFSYSASSAPLREEFLQFLILKERRVTNVRRLSSQRENAQNARQAIPELFAEVSPRA